MVPEAQVVIQQSVAVLDVQYRCGILQEIAASSPLSPPSIDPICSESCSTVDIRSPESKLESAILKVSPSIRSGSFADIGPRRYMEDQHTRTDDLFAHLGSLFRFMVLSTEYLMVMEGLKLHHIVERM